MPRQVRAGAHDLGGYHYQFQYDIMPVIVQQAFGRHFSPRISTLLSLTLVLSLSAGKHFSLHVGETTIDVPFQLQQAKDLDASFATLLQTFADKQKAERPKRWDMMEYRFKGDPAQNELELFEVFCNPNAHQNAFEAKLLITLKTKDGVKVTTEARLSNIKSDLDNFVGQQPK